MKKQPVDRKAAVALSYDPLSGQAPTVLASGYGVLAEKILEIASEHHIHVHKDDTLSQLLARVPAGTEIPEEAYQLVAELLAFLYQTDQRLAKKVKRP